MPSSEPGEKPRRFRRAAAWTGKAALKVAWGGVKLAARGLWWAGKAGYRAGKRAAERRRTEDRRRSP